MHIAAKRLQQVSTAAHRAEAAAHTRVLGILLVPPWPAMAARRGAKLLLLHRTACALTRGFPAEAAYENFSFLLGHPGKSPAAYAACRPPALVCAET